MPERVGERLNVEERAGAFVSSSAVGGRASGGARQGKEDEGTVKCGDGR